MEVPSDYNFVDVLNEHAEDRTKIAVYFENEEGERKKKTYWEIKDDACRFGNVLRDLGLEEGSRVFIILPRGTDVHDTRFGTWMIGGTVVPGTIMLRAENIKYRCQDCEPDVLLTDNEEVVEQVEKAWDDIPTENFILIGEGRDGWYNYEEQLDGSSRRLDQHPNESDDPLIINYTSGTTGLPKGVIHGHKWMNVFDRINRKYWWNTQPDDLCWATTEPGWAKWDWAIQGAVMNAGAANLHYNGQFDPEKWFELLEGYRVNRTCLTATELRAMIKVEDMGKYDLSDLDTIVSAGEALDPAIITQFRKEHGINVREAYGQTESCAIAGYKPGMRIKPGSMGMPMPTVDLKIVGSDGEEVPRGEVGEISINADHPMLLDGYWEKPEEEKESYVGDRYLTGDIAKMDEEGYVWFQSRADDVIISSGYRIGPYEVESAVNKHSSVLESAAVASPHEERGNIVKSYVVLKEGEEPSEDLKKEIQDLVKEETAPYKYPREIEFIDELPKTVSQKIKHYELAEREKEKREKA